MTEHAPGPWKFVNDDGDEIPFGWSSNGYYNNPKIVAADGTEVVGCGEYNVFSGYPYGRQEANVALILSAPTLAARLAAAEAVSAADGTLHNAIDHWQERAKAAEARLAEAKTERATLVSVVASARERAERAEVRLAEAERKLQLIAAHTGHNKFVADRELLSDLLVRIQRICNDSPADSATPRESAP